MPVSAPSKAWDASLDWVVQGVVQGTVEATAARGGAPVDTLATRQTARALIDATKQPRVLWVDDMPDNNRHESALLARLQIEEVAVTSTAAAMQALQTASAQGDDFDLVISDWARPGPTGGAPSAGIELLRAMRAAGHALPMVCYHGSFVPTLRQERRQTLLREGAFGEAVHPDELLALVAAALRQP